VFITVKIIASLEVISLLYKCLIAFLTVRNIASLQLISLLYNGWVTQNQLRHIKAVTFDIYYISRAMSKMPFALTRWPIRSFDF